MKIPMHRPGGPARPLARLLGACALAAGALAAVAAPPASAASTCTVAYSVVNNWPGGFQAGITVTNNGAPITSWTLAFTFPNAQQISGGWSGTYTQSGQYVTVTSMSYNGALGTGGSVSLGFTGTVGAVNAVPSYFTVNGFACNGAPQVPSVNITSPASGSGLTPGSSASITANASEPTASISKVEFFEASTLPGTSHTPVLIGTATASPYAVTWPSVPAGYYSLTAEAFDSAGVTGTSAPVAVAAVPATSTAPQLHVSGNQLVNASGTPVVLHGVNRSGGEFACVQGTGLWNGPMDQASITAMKSWGITAVRVPLNEACWNAESYVNSAYAGATYQSAVKAYVSLLGDNGIVAILDLHWTDGVYKGTSSGCPSAQATCQKPMPDAAQSVPFWTSVATTFKGNNAVIFDLFNEPYPSRADNFNETEGWQCWLSGGSSCVGISYTVAGMQTLVSAVRSAGANNVIMLGGLEYSNDLTQWLAHEPTDPAHNLVASWHSYNFNTCKTQDCWTSQIAPVAASVPVVAGEMGENDCADTYINPLMTWMDSQHISYLAWTWNNWDCSQGPALVTDWVGDPTPYGAGYQAHLVSLAGG
ncbi:MAG TPA: cellulase family glycosylhydrolase, partial [Streptosporangiaceae bacterium]